jgi:DNA polymerase-3 subunit epsilon
VIKFFSTAWPTVPTVWIDTETTGVRPGVDRTVQVGIVRFEGGKPVAEFGALVSPGIAIPAAATEIHGITDGMVADAPGLADVFASDEVKALLRDAQPAAYNAAFDRHFVPPFGDDWTWPFLDSLSLVRAVDRFERGKGRHKLAAVAARHGIELTEAHSAVADAQAAGEVFYRLAPTKFGPTATMGDVLLWQRQQECEEWHRFTAWLAKQPSRETASQ